ncbi:MAG: GyrI-like domain-containing protein [Bacteroidetes bacterium]|nr:GyrI-like domain-containing protein [Bacteroidota bacterium]MBU1117274.1 GyrI-like domain-containing protein [Bacteroidota bacterium]MBU1797386.1 GyrI-like domain-containing protein [Bacteroidota bacterium]
MAQKIEIVEKEIGHVLEIEENASMLKLPSLMGKDLTLILDYMKEKNVTPEEAPYGRYLDIDWDSQMKKGLLADMIDVFTKKWHFTVGFPTQRELEQSGNIKHKFFEKKKYVQTTHMGPYQKVGKTYKSMYIWAKNENLELENISIEFYLNDPKETKKNDLKTLVLIPIK